MKRLAFLFGSLLLASLPARAQRPRLEVSAGYNRFSFDEPGGPQIGLDGWNVAADVNLWRWLGIVADVTRNYNRQSSSDPFVNGTKTRIYTYLFGPRLYIVGHHRLTPFVDLFFGKATIYVTAPPVPPLPAMSARDSKFTYALGAGLDFTLTHRFALRGQADYVPTKFFGGRPNQKNARVSAGIVFRFGSR